jgi:ADP-heptose:LPS heptosyltransferase
MAKGNINMLLDRPMNVESSFWKQDATKRNLKPVSTTVMRNLGLTQVNTRMVKDLEELRESPPNIIISEAAKNTKFIQNWFKEQKLSKRAKYVMGLGVYQQLHYDLNTNTKILKPSTMKFKKIYRPYLGQELDDETILVFRTGGIGDLLFIQPNLNYLKEQYPDCYIKFACGPQYQAMLETWDCIDELLDLPFNIKHLQESKYHMLFEGVIERCKAAHDTNAYNLFSRWLGLDLPDELLLPKQLPKQELVNECRDILNSWGVKEKDFIVMQLRASSPVRTPRPEFWVNLIDKLTDSGMNILLTDNPRQTEEVDKFITLLKNKDKVYNFCEKSTSLDYTVALTSMSNGTIGTDSAMMHIAASMDIPCYGIYGPFPGWIRLKTYPKADWVDAEKECAPCFIHGHKPCPKAGFDGFSPCYDGLNIDEIVRDFEVLIND